QSPCAQGGELTCLNCHGMHEGDPRGQLRPDRLGAAACTQCHTEFTAVQAQARHARHPAGASLPECVDCHMPKLVYGVLDTHRSHRIEVPSPARAAQQERPDACTQCHVDRTRTWARDAEARMWPSSARAGATTRSDERGWSEVETQLFAGDPIERALAAAALGRPVSAAAAQPRRIALLLAVMVCDPYPAIRHLALRSVRALVRDPVLERFVPEQPEQARREQLAALRARYTLSAAELEHTEGLRAQASALAIDIGE
ncbi:MAG TPA: cytochrome c3 family protein, partial [Polyangiales bacterium]